MTSREEDPMRKRRKIRQLSEERVEEVRERDQCLEEQNFPEGQKLKGGKNMEGEEVVEDLPSLLS